MESPKSFPNRSDPSTVTAPESANPDTANPQNPQPTGSEPPASYVKLAMRNMVRKRGTSLKHFFLTFAGLLSLLIGLSYLTR
jgi:hypothetical protein